MEHQAKINFNQIDEYIYVGTNFCCQVHFEESLLDDGVRANISLENTRIDQPWGVDFFLWLPTVDGEAPDQEKLELGAKFIDGLVEKKVKMYIHCQNGHGRAPTLTAAYFIHKGKGVDEAINIIKEKRPEIHINERQRSALEEFKKNIL